MSKEEFTKQILSGFGAVESEGETKPETFFCPLCQSQWVNDEEMMVGIDEPVKEINCPPCRKVKRREALEIEFMRKVPTAFKNGLVRDFPGNLKESTNAIIYGTYGPGKSHTAYSLARELFIAEEIISWAVVREIEIINELRNDSMAGKKFMAYDFLAIDEFGKVNDTDFTKAQIFNILDDRNDWRKKTVLICNAKDLDDLRKIISSAIADRYKNCLIPIIGKSRR